MERQFVFTSESVTEGHPDKLCDRVSDAIVGHYVRQDPLARVVAECAVSTGIVFVSVKFASTASINVAEAVRAVVRLAGYEEGAFDARRCTVMTSLHEFPGGHPLRGGAPESSEDAVERAVAQDQATLFGFACRHTPAYLPLPIWLAHKLARRLSEVRRSGALPYLTPDGKTQVAVEFRGRTPIRIHGITLVATHSETRTPSLARLRADLEEQVVVPAFEGEPLGPDARTRVALNPEGLVGEGGPAFHAGLTGRKTAVDTYGEFARQSGAALSGKDPSRIDRTGAYAARHAAKNVVAAGLASECEVQLSYSIGLPRPVSVHVETFGTGAIPDEEIERRLGRVLDFRVGALERRLGLRELAARHPHGFFIELAAYGHVGRTDLDLPWERLDVVDALADDALAADA